MKPRNPIAKSVTRIRPQVMEDKREKEALKDLDRRWQEFLNELANMKLEDES